MHFLKVLTFVLVEALYVESSEVLTQLLSQDTKSCGMRSGGRSNNGNDGGSNNGEEENKTESLARVINGEAATENWPWMASIVRGCCHTCGGSVIDPKHIITAAHCFGDDGEVDPAEITVHVGMLSLGESDKDYQVESIERHEDYKGESDYWANDIAILTLQESLSDDVMPVCLPEGDDVGEGDKLTVIGFGAMQEGGEVSETLQEVHDWSIISTEECSSINQELNNDSTGVTDKQVCTKEDNDEKGSCQGDSGGPVMQQKNGTWTLIGLVSYSAGCARPGIPTVHTRVAAYTDWIAEHKG